MHSHVYHPHDQASTVEAARVGFILMRKEEMLKKRRALLLREAATVHKTRTDEVVEMLLKERPGALAGLIDLLNDVAEEIAQSEWPEYRPRMESA